MLSLEDDSQSKPTESQASAGRQQQGQQGDDSKLLYLNYRYLKLIINHIVQD